jgi:sortase A
MRRTFYELGLAMVWLGCLIFGLLGYQLWFTNVLQARAQHIGIHHIVATLPAPVRQAATAPVVVLPTGPAVPLPATKQAPVGSWIGLIQIPKIHLEQAIIQGTGEEQLRLGPGHYPATPSFGSVGNVAIAGHRTTFGRPFRYLDQLQPGDPIVITTPTARILYRVTSTLTVLPSNTSVINPTTTPTLTLTTCTPPYSASHRLVVHAVLSAVDRYVATPTTSTTTTTVPVTTTTAPVATTTVPDASALAAAGGSDGWWPVMFYGTLLALSYGLGLRWIRRSRHRVAALVTMLVVATPCLLAFYQGVTWILPANY